ncbi:2-succinyl-5-enolpyruvyl-6-hydroxy-3-cyclohexene-1-carboxylic-acid synthase [Arsenicicoccus dermatophilus]|uniref:2-succinyl-5-enolpyruvyl-6-hydroxy-3- cyclohexene-1-carboxylic-acid synthase n=1 Tax=Arsenicicoccus dermatophilus TaxID=1076331 RepID=UPI003916D72C
MNPSQALAEVLVDELVRQGVREAVLCPGSRSAPLAYALQDADRAGRLRLHVRVDERSGAFLALGLAKATRQVVPVVTTSGTAVANLHPAVLEAHHAGIPLLVLSADRPVELQRTGANQTTVQPGMFGEAVRWQHTLPAPGRRAGQQAVWRSVVARACAAATGALSGWAGPVHLDVCLRDPLLPDLPGGGEDWPEPLDGRPGGEPWTRVSPAPTDSGAGLELVPRTVVALGDLPEPDLAAEAVELARTMGWPVVAEPFGTYDRAAVVPHGPLLLTATDWLDRHLPDRVLVVGRLTLTRDVAALLRRVDRVECVTPLSDWPDPGARVTRVHPWGALAATRSTAPPAGPHAPGPHAPGADHDGGGTTGARTAPDVHGSRTDQDVLPTDADRAWLRAWQEAGAALAAEPPWPADEVSGPTVASAVLVAAAARARKAPGPAEADLAGAATPGVVFVGSSQSARDVDRAVTADLGTDLCVLGSRGLAGIDGCVSTAVGLALGLGRPVTALLGDLTFLHDSGGLLIGPAEPRPDLTIVVTNDDGGAIFTTLEHGAPERDQEFERIFATPTRTDLGALCTAHGVPHERVTTLAALRSALDRNPAGLRVVEVVTDRSRVREQGERLRAEVARRVGAGA